MKNFLLALCSLAVFIGKAGDNYTDYGAHIAADRLLLMFQPGVSAAEKAALITASGLVNSFTHLPSPALTICLTDHREDAAAYFQEIKEVRFVSFFITDGKNYAGVLDDFFVKISDKNFEPMLLSKLRELGLTHFYPDNYIPNLFHVRMPNLSGKETIAYCHYFTREGWCAYAAPNYLLNPVGCSSDPYYNRQWAIENTGSVLQGHGTAGADMRVDSAWTFGSGNPNIRLAIIDSGVDTLHEDLAGNLLPGYDAISDSTDGYPTPAYKEDGHGTCCAGIAAAVKDNNKGIAGIAPSCKIIPVRAFYYLSLSGGNNPLPYSTADAFSKAIGWAWSTAQADVLSNSWGLPPALVGFLPGGLQPVNDALQQAALNGRGGKGVPMFFSSGNDNDSAGVIWPASLPQTIAVNATDMCDQRKSPADCSGENWGGDYGTGLDFSAPGVRIATTDMNGSNGFSTSNYTFTFNGTSAACPNAAGVGALLLSLRPDLSAEDVRNILAQTADRVGGYDYNTNTANGRWSKELGYGRLNAFQALQHALYYSSVKDGATDNFFSVFPNPSTGVFQLRSAVARGVWSLYNSSGIRVSTGTIIDGKASADISSLPSGIYCLNISGEQQSATKRLVLVH